MAQYPGYGYALVKCPGTGKMPGCGYGYNILRARMYPELVPALCTTCVPVAAIHKRLKSITVHKYFHPKVGRKIFQ